MGKTATLSTTIDAKVKKAASQFCARRGLKLCYMVEQAIIEQLEDEIDLEAYRLRRGEPTVSLEKLLAGQRRR